MTVEELKERIDRGDVPVVLDVREAYELEIAAYPVPVVHIPLGALPERFRELPEGVPIVCACRSGGRSAQAARFLAQHGYAQAENLEGGILAYASRVDPTIPKY